MDRYAVHIFVDYVKAESEEEAKKKAEDMLYELAGSNDGSEVLANATPILYWQDPYHQPE